ncbi:hypothetical protein MPER_08943, partial [Moniliophthora perniciosa FA553]
TKDPIMAHFPLALAIEPRLLPYAAANGFRMDSKQYRDFVFRKMFENVEASDRKPEDIDQNVTELCRLDSTMSLTRTVAAEVCMEARANDVGFNALKRLNKGGHLLFDLSVLVRDLLKLFLKTRSITSANIQNVIRYLYSEFPSSDPAVRLVVLLTVFLPASSLNNVSVATIKSRLEELKFGPVTKQDLYNLLIHPLTDRCDSILNYMRTEMASDQGHQGLSEKEINRVVDDVAARLIEVDCKGKTLKKLCDSYPSVHEVIARTVLDVHQIDLYDLPQADDTDACPRFRAKLCRDTNFRPSELDYFWDSRVMIAPTSSENVEPKEMHVMAEAVGTGELGEIGQESLTSMIRQDELAPGRSRRRMSYFSSYSDFLSHLPLEPLLVGRWVKAEY